MASIPSHMIFGAALASCFARSPKIGQVVGVAAVCAAVPDSDAIGFWLGVPYDSTFGHRGFTHSLAFALLLATIVVFLWGRNGIGGTGRPSLWLLLFLATASHGMLDMLTDGGHGVAVLSPFSSARYFFPWRPIAVSPIGVHGLLSDRGLRILSTESRWIWLPAAGIAMFGTLLRRRLARAVPSSPAIRPS